MTAELFSGFFRNALHRFAFAMQAEQDEVFSAARLHAASASLSASRVATFADRTSICVCSFPRGFLLGRCNVSSLGEKRSARNATRDFIGAADSPALPWRSGRNAACLSVRGRDSQSRHKQDCSNTHSGCRFPEPPSPGSWPAAFGRFLPWSCTLLTHLWVGCQANSEIRTWVGIPAKIIG